MNATKETTTYQAADYSVVVTADQERMKIAGMQARLAVLMNAERQSHRESLLTHSHWCPGCLGCFDPILDAEI